MSNKKYKLVLNLDNNINEKEFTFSKDLDDTDKYILYVRLNPEEVLTKDFPSSSDLTKILNYELQMGISSEDSSEEINTLKELINNKTNMMDLISSVSIIVDESDNKYKNLIQFLLENKTLRDKQIDIKCDFDFTKEDINVMRRLESIYPNILYSVDGNTIPVSIDVCEKTLDAIDLMVEKVKKYNFSPLEQVMYIYDVVRDRVYTRENTGESYRLSRDLSDVLLGDKIVCLGFSQIFDKILKKLGISSEIYYLDGQNNIGHARNIIYLKDDKYDVEGIYFLDATWGCKRKEQIDAHWYSYRWFAKTGKYFAKLDSLKGLSGRRFNLMDSKNLEYLAEEIQKGNINAASSEDIRNINYISKLINDGEQSLMWVPAEFSNLAQFKMQYSNKEAIVKRFNRYSKLVNAPIDASILVEVLYNVRKCQYYEEPEKYPFSIEAFNKIVTSSTWNFNDLSPDGILMLLRGDTLKEVNSKAMSNYAKKTNLKQRIEQVKLTKVLRKVYEKKVNNK